MKKSIIIPLLITTMLIATIAISCNGNDPPEPVTYEMLDSIVVGWGRHFTPDTIVVGDTLVAFHYRRYMPRTVAFWKDSQIVETDTIPYYGIYLKEVKREKKP